MDNPTPTIPSEISDQLLGFHEKLEKLEGSIKPLISNNINSSDLKLSSLDRARLNLTTGYALNSLFWMYLNTLGVNPKEHPIKTELERYKSYMQRLKEIADKVKAPVLDSGAAKRFVRNALWDPKDKNESENPEDSTESVPPVGSKRPNTSNEHKKRRRHQKAEVKTEPIEEYLGVSHDMMGCGASKAVSAHGDPTSDELETISSSITQIRDIAPTEVADTGAHPPRLDDPIRRNLYYQAATTLSLPGVVPEPLSESERLSSSARRGESLIKMHPPKRPQRLEDSDLPTVMALEPEVSIQG